METKEKRFEQDIETFFLSDEGGYISLKSSQFDVNKCICMDVLCRFIEKTQPKAWAKYLKYYGENAQEKLYFRLEKCISEQGLIYVLRHGIEDLGIKLKVCYFKPETTLNDIDVERYEANILGCTRQFRYSPHNTNTIDMVLSVNGIPVVSIELKNQLKGQDYQCAIRQYKNDRSSKEFCFRLDHRFLVYFAVDLYEVWMTTQEGFILDVLQDYTTIREAFKLVKVSEDNPELIEGAASKALFKYYKKHGYTITQKTEMLMANFLANGRFQIGGKGKAMVVADSRANAVRYYLAIKQYLKDHPQESAGCDVMIAFSGEVTLEEMPMEKPFTEASMNLDENGKYITTDTKSSERCSTAVSIISLL